MRRGGNIVQENRAAEIEATDEQGNSVADGARWRNAEAACPNLQATRACSPRQELRLQFIDAATVVSDGRVETLLAFEDDREIGRDVVRGYGFRCSVDAENEQQMMSALRAAEDHAHAAAIRSRATVTMHGSAAPIDIESDGTPQTCAQKRSGLCGTGVARCGRGQ